MSSTLIPDLRARETNLPMASVLAVVELPDLPIIAKTSNGLPSYSVILTKIAQTGLYIGGKPFNRFRPVFYSTIEITIIFLVKIQYLSILTPTSINSYTSTAKLIGQIVNIEKYFD
jgi:hypothetical protein